MRDFEGEAVDGGAPPPLGPPSHSPRYPRPRVRLRDYERDQTTILATTANENGNWNRGEGDRSHYPGPTSQNGAAPSRSTSMRTRAALDQGNVSDQIRLDYGSGVRSSHNNRSLLPSFVSCPADLPSPQ